MQVLKAGVLYFFLVFAAGFILGPMRILWLVPHVGTRAAELLEMPVMLAVMICAARWIVRRRAAAFPPGHLLAMGLFALVLLLGSEFTLVLWLRGLPVADYLAGRDAVSGTVYNIMLGLFAVMPLLVRRT
jgi:hypothetical protein